MPPIHTAATEMTPTPIKVTVPSMVKQPLLSSSPNSALLEAPHLHLRAPHQEVPPQVLHHPVEEPLLTTDNAVVLDGLVLRHVPLGTHVKLPMLTTLNACKVEDYPRRVGEIRCIYLISLRRKSSGCLYRYRCNYASQSTTNNTHVPNCLITCDSNTLFHHSRQSPLRWASQYTRARTHEHNTAMIAEQIS